MCFGCGYSAWHRPEELAPPPTKEEDIYLDQWTNFYPDYRQGIHPPGPVYQGQGYHPYGSYNGMHPYGGGMYSGMSPYHMNSGYYPYSGYGGYSNVMQQPMCPASMTSQAAAAAAANKALAGMPNGPNYYVGGNPAEIASQQAIVAANMGMSSGSMAPYKPSDGQQFWCKELDGSWTLRSYSGIALGDVSPGHWERHMISGYYFWVRQPA